MNPPAPRTYLGSAHSLVERVRVYWTDKGLEVDSSEGYEIRRTRVLFDEVLLVTLHSRLGGTLPWLPIVFAPLIGFMAALFEEAPLLSRLLTWTALGLLGIGIALFFVPQWVVTVFGRRTRARLQFRLRERKARDVFARICHAADETQRSLRALEPIQETPPEPPPLPLSDSESPIAPV